MRGIQIDRYRIIEGGYKKICPGYAGTLNYPLRETPTQPGYASLLLNTALVDPSADALIHRAYPAEQHDPMNCNGYCFHTPFSVILHYSADDEQDIKTFFVL